MISRLIIEQKIKDLELAFQRQEELLKSQREVLNSLKDLISMELDGVEDQSPLHTNRNDPSPSDVHYSAKEPTPVKAAPKTAPQFEVAAKTPVDQRKRLREATVKENRSPTPESLPVKVPRFQPSASTGIPLGVMNSIKRRRAIEKVKQFCSSLPALFPVPWTVSTGRLMNAAPPASSSSSRQLFTTIDKVSQQPSSTPSEDRGNLQNTSFSIMAKSSSTPAVAKPAVPTAAPPPPVATLAPTIIPRFTMVVAAPPKPTAAQLISQGRTCQTMLAKLDIVKKLTGLEAKELKTFLEHEGRDLLLSWLSMLESDTDLNDPSLPDLLEGSLRLVRQVAWTNDTVSQTRVDKLLRKLFKKYTGHSNILTEGIEALLRDMWSEYRYAYSTFKASGAGGRGLEEEDDGGHDPSAVAKIGAVGDGEAAKEVSSVTVGSDVVIVKSEPSDEGI